MEEEVEKKKTEPSTEERLNYESLKEQNKSDKHTRMVLLNAILRGSVREEVIAVLKKLKIVKYEFVEATGNLELVERR